MLIVIVTDIIKSFCGQVVDNGTTASVASRQDATVRRHRDGQYMSRKSRQVCQVFHTSDLVVSR